MSWASRRRVNYIAGIILFLIVVVSVPVVRYFYRSPSCSDGIQNQSETAPDKGGPCTVLDERTLAPSSVLWSRSFKVRNGSYSATAYIENPNDNAGVRAANYHFGLYDNSNVLIAERNGTTPVMPGTITPVFEGNINTGNREVARTYFEFTRPLVWERSKNPAVAVAISNRTVKNADTMPRVEATAENTSVAPISDLSFIAVVLGPSGNARAASQTAVSRLNSGEKQQIVFTWPEAFGSQVGRIDILPIMTPVLTPIL